MATKYWLVSPNVKNHLKTIEAWKKESIERSAAFMGYDSNSRKHKMGPKFAGKNEGIMPDDVVLIARRSKGEPDVVGFGVVKGEYIKIKRLKGFKTPGKDDDYGSLRNLQPFIIDYSEPPRKLIGVLPPRGAALRQLHPENGGAHEQVCDWMDRHPRIKDGKAGRKKRASTKSKNKRKLRLHSVVIIDPPKSYRGDYEVRTRKQKSKATKVEAGLVKSYSRWLKKQGRKLRAITYNGGLQCDRYEEEPRNLIEAKASTSRENIRMAVGQLLDYAFLGKEEIHDPNMAILLPEKPDSDLVEWLRYLHIRIIWREKEAFKDNANGWFTSKRENCPAPP